MPGFQATLRNDLDEVERINALFAQFARDHGLADKVRQQMSLVFDELISNVVTYGFDDDASHEIAVGVALDAGVLTVTVEDDGRPFDPRVKPTLDLSLDVDERPVGGWGLLLVHEFVDDMAYERRAGRNVLVLTKKVAQGRR